MDYQAFIKEFENLSGIKLYLYKEKQMKRRIETYIGRKSLSGYDEFLDFLAQSSREQEIFKDYITINVTEFFRTPDQWQCFVETALADIIGRQTDSFSIWSTASSTGEEPYSLAMSIMDLMVESGFHIIASDIDERVLTKAKVGLYNEDSVSTIPDDMRERYFSRKNAFYIVSDDVKSHIDFTKLDLLCDEYPSDLDAIVCRNVLIYFTDEAKDQIYKAFLKSLKPGGYLFVGNTEQIVYYKKYGYRKICKFLYQKPLTEEAGTNGKVRD